MVPTKNETFHNRVWHYTQSSAGTCLFIIIKVVTTSPATVAFSHQHPSSLPHGIHQLESLPPQSTAAPPPSAESSLFSLAVITLPYLPEHASMEGGLSDAPLIPAGFR
jgi:hypothetical protein